MISRIYDGGVYCGHCGKCPVADHDPKTDTVRLHDPAKPQNGAFTMTAKEYNTLLANAQPVLIETKPGRARVSGASCRPSRPRRRCL